MPKFLPGSLFTSDFLLLFYIKFVANRSDNFLTKEGVLFRLSFIQVWIARYILVEK